MRKICYSLLLLLMPLFAEVEKEQLRADTIRVFFEPQKRTTLSSEVATTVKEVSKRMGESFKKGELLIQLSDTVSLSKFKKGDANLSKAQAEFHAKEELFKDNIASTFEVKTAEANVASSEFDLESARKELDSCKIRAPYSGKVVSLMVEEHELVQAAQPLIQIVNDDTLIGKVLLPANLAGQIKIGKVLKIRVEETGTIVTGKVIRIDAVIDPSSSTLKFDIEVDNGEDLLKAGMIGQTFLDGGNFPEELLQVRPVLTTLEPEEASLVAEVELPEVHESLLVAEEISDNKLTEANSADSAKEVKVTGAGVGKSAVVTHSPIEKSLFGAAPDAKIGSGIAASGKSEGNLLGEVLPGMVQSREYFTTEDTESSEESPLLGAAPDAKRGAGIILAGKSEGSLLAEAPPGTSQNGMIAYAPIENRLMGASVKGGILPSSMDEGLLIGEMLPGMVQSREYFNTENTEITERPLYFPHVIGAAPDAEIGSGITLAGKTEGHLLAEGLPGTFQNGMIAYAPVENRLIGASAKGGILPSSKDEGLLIGEVLPGMVQNKQYFTTEDTEITERSPRISSELSVSSVVKFPRVIGAAPDAEVGSGITLAGKSEGQLVSEALPGMVQSREYFTTEDTESTERPLYFPRVIGADPDAEIGSGITLAGKSEGRLLAETLPGTSQNGMMAYAPIEKRAMGASRKGGIQHEEEIAMRDLGAICESPGCRLLAGERP